ncbi:MAG: glycosyltransferase family 39 protein [Blastocatellia bacterium]
MRDRTPLPWDPADHLRYAYDYYRLLAHGELAGFAREFFSSRHFYAPFVHLVTAAVFLIFGASKLSGILVNIVSLASLLLAVTWISRHLFARAAGPQPTTDEAATAQPSIALSVLPALLASCYHFSAWLQHDAFLDFPLIAIVTISFALLIRAGEFRERRAALAFAVSAGIGMLVKQTFAFFFVLPALYVVIRVLRTRDSRAIRNLVLATVVLVSIAAIWYGPHLHDMITIYRENSQAAASENEAPLFSFDSNIFYLHALVSMQMQLPLAILFGAGLIYSFIRCRNQSVVLYLWLLSGIVAFAMVANKDVRYTVPVLPAAALLSTCWLREFKSPANYLGATIRNSAFVVKIALVFVIASWAFVSFFNAQWPKPGSGTFIDSPRYRWMVFARNYYGFDHRPLDDDWSVPEIVRTLSDRQTGSPPVLGVVVNLPFLNPSTVAMCARLMTKERAGPPLVTVKWVIAPWMIDRIEDCDYVLVRNGLDKVEFVTPIERDVERLIRDNSTQFVQVASFPTPLKDAEAVIYRNTNR